MRKSPIFICLLLLCFTCTIFAQEEEVPVVKQDQQVDSIQTAVKKEGIIIQEVAVKKSVEINPLAPAKAAFYSAILPGLGQIYNKRYWKVPIVYAAIGTSIYAYDFNNSRYKRFRTAFKRRQAGFSDDEFWDLPPKNVENPSTPEYSTSALQDGQEKYQRDRDLMLLLTIGLYALNVIDANVDAHLKQFNVDDNLSFDFKPYLDYNNITAEPNYGMALTIKF